MRQKILIRILLLITLLNTVNIDCPDLNPSKFSVSAGTFKRATSSKTYIQIIYSPSNYVKAVAGDGSFTFTNK